VRFTNDARAIVAVAVTLVAGCSAGGGDGDFWSTTHDLGGAHYDFQGQTPPPSSGGETYTSPQLPPSNGGFSESGGAPASGGFSGSVGNGGFVGGGGSSGSVGNGGFESSGGFVGGGGFVGNGGVESSGGFVGNGGITASGGFVGTGGFIGNGGTTSSGGASGAGGTTGVAGKCSFTFSVTTVTANGRYAPRNVGAIWITNSGGTFVKTLDVWGTIRLSNATAWVNASRDVTTDAVTGATRGSHGPLSAHWDCTDSTEQPVAPGSYTVSVTFAEDDASIFFGPPAHEASVMFTVGSGPVNLSPANQTNFTNMQVTLQ
jgi:hypothetical protein